MIRIQAFVRTGLLWVFSGFLWTSFLLIHCLFLGKLPEKVGVFAVNQWGKIGLKILGIETKCINKELVAGRDARVVICNHQSALDMLWGATIYAPGGLVIGKKEVIFLPFINIAWWALKFIRLDRSDPKKAIAALAGVAREINEHQRTLYIAPEGTRTDDGSILPFKKGAFHIAVEGGIPIFPIVVSGAYELMPKSSLVAKSGKINLHFLPPEETKGLETADIEALIQRIRHKMLEHYEQMKANQHAVPA